MFQTGLQITCLWQYFSADSKFSEIHEVLLYNEKFSVQLWDCFWPKNCEKYIMLKQWKVLCTGFLFYELLQYLKQPSRKKKKKIALSWKWYRGVLKKTFKVAYLSNVRHMAEIQSPGSQWRPDLVSVCISLASECLSSRNVLIFKVPVGKRSINATFYRRDGGAESTVAPGSQNLPVMEKHQCFLPLIPHHHYPSLSSSGSISCHH